MTAPGCKGATAGGLPRRAARLFFRHHIENGLSVSLCLATVALGAGAAFGLEVAVLASTGAMCVSIVDQPGPLAGKLRLFAAALIGTTLVSLLAGLAGGSPWGMALVVALTSLGMAMATAFGRPALSLAISGVLSLIIGMAVPAPNAAAALHQSTLFFAGGAAYALLALVAAQLLDDRDRRMFLNEALLAFAAYLRARAGLYDRAQAQDAALAAVIESHGAFMERLQAARESIFSGHIGPRRVRWVAGMLALLDIYEAVLSSDADWETLRTTAGEDALALLAALIRAMAEDVDAVALALVSPGADPPERGHEPMLAALDAELAKQPEHRDALEPTREKLARGLRRTRRLADVVAQTGGNGLAVPELDLAAFLQPPSPLLPTLRREMSFSSPVMRYAIRLTLAMLAGYGATIAFPAYVHGGWILLTVALIMRASYAITRQRRNDRILGTLMGCAAAAVLMPLLPGYAVVTGIILGVGAAHAFATVNYRVTSFTASFMALLLLHFLEPHTAFVADRVVDTLIGAALSILFSRVLPSWERRDVPRLIANLIEADRQFAREALTPPVASDQSYRLVRKAALDSFTALAMTTRRLASEPDLRAEEFAQINELLAANYLFASDLSSVQGLLRARADEIDQAAAAALLATTQSHVLAALTGPDDLPPPERLRRRGWSEIAGTDPMTFLRRRLLHIEHSAQRLAVRAARAVR